MAIQRNNVSRRWLVKGAASLVAMAAISPARAAAAGRRRVDIRVSSANARERPVSVWLPPSYDQVSWGFPVIYVQEGSAPPGCSAAQMADLADALAAEGAMSPVIVVGIGSSPDRLRELCPKEAAADLPPLAGLMLEAACPGPSLAGAYLKYLTDDLKPTVDLLFRTLVEAERTSIIGWGMGGMGALQAVGGRPKTFGNAAWLAGAKPLVPYRDVRLACNEVDRVERAVDRAFLRVIPRAGTHRFYLDHGDVGTDLFSCVFQSAAEKALDRRGYREGRDFISEGEPHPDFRRVPDEKKIRAALSLFLRRDACRPRPGED
jgi:hypothetical protein